MEGVAFGGSIACCNDGVGIIADEAGLILESGEAFMFMGEGAYIDEGAEIVLPVEVD